MNAFFADFFGLQTIIDAPVWVLLLLKLTAILSAAWLAHLALARANPRWRIFLWRMTAVGLIALPVVSLLLPAMEIHVLPSPSVLPSPFGRGAGGEGGGVVTDRGPSEILPTLNTDQRFAESWAGGEVNGETERVENDVVLHDALTLALSQRERGLMAWTAAHTKSLLLFVWLGGIVVLALRLCIGHYRICRMGNRAAQPPQWISDGCMRVARAIGCRTRVEVLQSSEVSSPFLCGLRRPRLLLPVRMCDDAYCADLPGIFAHELTHVRSGDLFWNAMLHLISIVFWFHPLVWRIRKAHLAACELVCDAVSANYVGDVSEYCRTLARVAVDICATLPSPGIAMARTSAIGHRLGALRKRVFHQSLRRRSVSGFSAAALLAVVVLGMLQFAMATPPAPTSTGASCARATRAGPATARRATTSTTAPTHPAWATGPAAPTGSRSSPAAAALRTRSSRTR